MNTSDTQGNLAERYEQVYSAAARMLWVQENPNWRREVWPEQRRAAWAELEAVLRDADEHLPMVGPLSDPTRHLLSRRSAGPDSQDRPISFDEAVSDWKARLEADPGFLEARQEPFPDYYMEPGACVVVHPHRHLVMVGIFLDLFHRLAPGRPSCTIGAEAAELSQLVHEAADALRAPLTGQTATPHPGEARWISPTSQRVSAVPGLAERYERLCQAAWRAAETVPSKEELKAARDYSVKRDVADTAVLLKQLLTGQAVQVWREQREQVDPAHHLLPGLVSDDKGRERPLSFLEECTDWREAIAETPAPSTPTEYQRQFYPDRGETDIALSATRALVFAEILDEFAARVYPGRVSGMIEFSAYEFVQFIKWGIGRELRAHSGF
ncbi:hypothetical protein ACWGCW_08375 [Streptomyces sp. NPDC054933]